MSTVVKIVETEAKEISIVRSDELPDFLYRDLLTLGQDFAWRSARDSRSVVKVDGDFVFFLDCDLVDSKPVFVIHFGSKCSDDVSTFAMYDHVAQVLEALKNQERR